MKRAISLVLSGIFALSLALATPALALNPQPLPPGKAYPGWSHGVAAFVAGHHGQFYPCRLAMCRR
jgi:hypothetical protein